MREESKNLQSILEPGDDLVDALMDDFVEVRDGHATSARVEDAYDDCDSSQHTNYSVGLADITDLILAFPATQVAEEEKSLDSTTTSVVTTTSLAASQTVLGKRKAQDISSASIIEPAYRPWNAQRPAGMSDPENPFLQDEAVGPVSANPYAPIAISPSGILQKMWDKRKLPYGVQYEIARLVSLDKIQYHRIPLDNVNALAQMLTNREAAPMTANIILSHVFEEDGNDLHTTAFAKEIAAKSPWEELDREEEALRKSPYGVMGFDENGQRLPWYGGKVLFHGKLKDTSKNAKVKQYKIVLQSAELGPSNNFARRFGSKHFFRLKLPKQVLNPKHSDDLLNFIRRPLILCGSVFRAFLAKESNVFFVKTNEPTDGVTVLKKDLVPGTMSFMDFLNWFNPILLNRDQKMAKYVSRFGLGLSTSVPGIMLKPSNIKFIDDIISPTGSNMTDGAGSTNRWCLNLLRHHLDWECVPSAIQVRLLGTKGLLVDDYHNSDETPFVGLTPSQRKIDYSAVKNLDPSFLTMDVLRASHARSPASLSVETIINLAENGVPRRVFIDLLQEGLKNLVEPLLNWDDTDALRRLWCEMRRFGGVMGSRRARENAALSRVKGYSDLDAEESDTDDDDDPDSVDPSKPRPIARWADEISGCPSQLEETVMYLLDSGFTPQTCPILRTKMSYSIKSHVDRYAKKYKIEVPKSFTAFIIPDRTGILKPGQFFFKSSKPMFKIPDGRDSYVLQGAALAHRYPCKLPSDVQKWTAVDIIELHHLVDVIVLPTQGDRRPSDDLAGGDNDGDKVTITYQEQLVDEFKPSSLEFAHPPDGIMANFKKENTAVTQFLERTEHLSDDAKIRQIQEYLLAAVQDKSIVGKYSIFHETCAYIKGYTHPETIRLAYMFSLSLDGAKTGMKVSPEVLKEDTKKYQKRSPAWKESEEERDRFQNFGYNEQNVERPPSLGRFIMDDLHKQGQAEGDKWKVIIEQRFTKDISNRKDEHLVRPWADVVLRSKRWIQEDNNHRMGQELEAIENHVKKIHNEHCTELSSPSRRSPKKVRRLSTKQQQAKLRELSLNFASFPAPNKFLTMSNEEVAAVKASYAYSYDYDLRSTGGPFPWNIAMRELCLIKARALGRLKPVDRDFYDHFTIKHPKTYET